MRAKVLKDFKDKYSGKIHKAGAVITVSKERFAEINSVAPLVEKVEETKKAKTAAE